MKGIAANQIWRWHAGYLLVNQKLLVMPQVLSLAMPPAEASPEVAQEGTHEGERRHPPVNALLSVTYV